MRRYALGAMRFAMFVCVNLRLKTLTALRSALCALLFPSLRESAVKYYLQNFYQVIVRNREVCVCRLSRQTKKEVLCVLYVSAVNKS